MTAHAISSMNGESPDRGPGCPCEMMTRQVADWQCDMHAGKCSCADAAIDFIAKFREYGILVRDGGSSSILISYCPWCGVRLPDSQRGAGGDARSAA